MEYYQVPNKISNIRVKMHYPKLNKESFYFKSLKNTVSLARRTVVMILEQSRGNSSNEDIYISYLYF